MKKVIVDKEGECGWRR